MQMEQARGAPSRESSHPFKALYMRRFLQRREMACGLNNTG
jgi:hypothetical protein